MSNHLNHNTRRQLEAIAKRNREDAATLAKIHMELILRDEKPFDQDGEQEDAVSTMLLSIHHAKSQASIIEHYLTRTDTEAPAIARKN